MDNHFECKFYEEKMIDNQTHFKCKNVKYGVQACKLKEEFCGYLENCDCCKNQDTDKCDDCFVGTEIEENEEYE